MMNRYTPIALALSTLLTISAPLSADPAAQQQIDRLQQQVDTLQQRLTALEERIDAGVPTNKALKVEPKPGGWRNAGNWRLLADGMTADEVVRILGVPDSNRTVRKFEYWEYGDGLARLYMDRLKSWEVPSQAR